MKYFIDTNIFLRVAIIEDKKTFEECEKVLSAVKSGLIDAVTSSVVLAEMVWVLGKSYNEPKKKIVKLLKYTMNINGLGVVDDFDMTKALELYEAYNVKFIDAMLASIPEILSKKWTVISYDEDFKKLPVKWLTPGNL